MDNDSFENMQPSDIVNAIWKARRENEFTRVHAFLRLLCHDDPTVREEVISLVFVKWKAAEWRSELVKAISGDPDIGVRARAAAALAVISQDSTRNDDVNILKSLALNESNDELLRKMAYEALVLIATGTSLTMRETESMSAHANLQWVRSL